MERGFDYTGVTTVFYCHDGEGNFIMAKRSQNARDEQGRWDIGGGGLEFGISYDESLKKEIKEEYCCDILNHEFLGFRDVHRNIKDKKSHWISLDFKVLVKKNQMKIGEPYKFDEIGWFTLDMLPPKEQLHTQLPYFLEKYKDKL